MANPYFSLLRTSWKYAGAGQKKYVFCYCIFICANILYSLNPILLGWFLGNIQKNASQAIYYTVLYAFTFIGLRLLELCLHMPARNMERQLAFNISRNYLLESYHQVLHLPVKWHQDHHSGATIHRIRKAYEALKTFFDRGYSYLQTICKFVFSMIAMLYFSPLFGTIAILLGWFTIWVIFKFNRSYISTLKEVNEREHMVAATLSDSLSNITTVIMLRLEKSMETGLLNKVQQIFPFFRRNMMLNSWKWFCADMLVALIYGVIAIGYMLQQWQPGRQVYVTGLVTLLGYVVQYTMVFRDILWQYTDVVQDNAHMQSASSIKEMYALEHRAEAMVQWPQNWQLIKIRNVSFSYQPLYKEEFSAQSLHRVHLDIRRGCRIALIGASGSGKSTLLGLLRGLHMPEPAAELTVNNKVFDVASLQSVITLIPQEPEIFENTIHYNITLGLPFSEADINKACDIACFTEVIKQLPGGIHSDIREKGVNLSGGQKQRLALTRGILAALASDIILLDEPSSSVDPRTEAAIYSNLFNAFPHKTIISAIHRLHLLSHFDYIYVFQKGTIAGEGTSEYLKANNAVFRELWNHQQETPGPNQQ
jgi:ATP-binding cassette, subfamily B, bacterial